MYPLWVRLIYKEFGEELGYMGSVTSRTNLIEVVRRLEIQVSEIQSFSINNELQPQSVIERLIEEVNKTRGDGDELKQGKRPTNKQKQIIKDAGYKPENWLVTKHLQEELHIVNRSSNTVKVIAL